jgi:hypothetical protein
MFLYYSLSSTSMDESAFTMGGDAWRSMLSDCEIPEPNSRFCK